MYSKSVLIEYPQFIFFTSWDPWGRKGLETRKSLCRARTYNYTLMTGAAQVKGLAKAGVSSQHTVCTFLNR